MGIVFHFILITKEKFLENLVYNSSTRPIQGVNNFFLLILRLFDFFNKIHLHIYAEQVSAVLLKLFNVDFFEAGI